jgi:glutathione synthase/RimK-type ligase-like ATP-grasp enzyme
MGRIRIWPYRQGSRSALALAEALGGRVLLREGSKFTRRSDDTIINWGDGQCPLTQVLNNPEAIRLASNKREAFARLQAGGVPVPAFATSIASVQWEGLTVVRHKLTGHSGEGIELADASKLPPAPLYVQYVKKQHEFRVHVVGKSIIAIQRKARDKDNPNPNWQVRNHANGFIFVREGFTAPQAVSDQAIRAIEALGLDFGAVDIIWNEKQQQSLVLEVNTAPGLEGQTVNDYAEGFRNILVSRRG